MLVRSLCVLLLLMAAACGTSRSDAAQLARQGRHREVVAALEGEDRLTPSEAVLLGEAQLELNELDDAVRSFNLARVRAGHGDPSAFRALFGLGNVAMLRRDGTTALFYFEEAYAHAPDQMQRTAAQEGRIAARLLMDETPVDVANYDDTTPPVVLPPHPPSAYADRDPPGPPGRGLARPVVLSRSSWGARPIVRADAVPMNGISRITIHHTGEPSSPPPASQREDAARLRRYQNAHMDDNHWADLGYHFVIDPSGRIWEGRELRWQGAHAGDPDSNRHNVGVALIGNFDVSQPTAAQKASLTSLVRWLVNEFRVPQSGLYTHQQIKRVYRLPATACPGRHLAEFVETLKTTLRAEFSLAPPPADGRGRSTAAR